MEGFMKWFMKTTLWKKLSSIRIHRINRTHHVPAENCPAQFPSPVEQLFCSIYIFGIKKGGSMSRRPGSASFKRDITPEKPSPRWKEREVVCGYWHQAAATSFSMSKPRSQALTSFALPVPIRAGPIPDNTSGREDLTHLK